MAKDLLHPALLMNDSLSIVLTRRSSAVGDCHGGGVADHSSTIARRSGCFGYVDVPVISIAPGILYTLEPVPVARRVYHLETDYLKSLSMALPE